MDAIDQRATAVVGDPDSPRVRRYDVRDGRLEAAGLVAGAVSAGRGGGR